ncbi:hypothetical protein [Halocatena halophila]|uniref:hypothetical protein n=1 Tax=Halocatena halophila TaxID=2814576 RepID=UPI002ED5F9C0
MPSFILDLDILVENNSPKLEEVATQVQVEPGFIRELKRTFGNDLDSVSELEIGIQISNICELAWEDNENSEKIQKHTVALAERLHGAQKANKGLLFHSTSSEVLIAHYRENEGWVKDSDILISGDRVDKDSVISMFALEASASNRDVSVVNADYYTDSTTIMQIFNVLSDDILQEIPDREVYLNGEPVYDGRYSVRYSFGRWQCIEMLDDGSLRLDSDSETFTIEKQHDAKPRLYNYTFDGGRFGLLRCDKLWKFEREYFKHKHGWLTSKRVYRHLVNKENTYKESRTEIKFSDSTIRKCEKATDHGHVVFAKHNDDGVLTQEFADKIIRSITSNKQYRLYFASHQDVPEHENLRFESGDYTLVFPNIDAGSITKRRDELQLLYDQATNDGLPLVRQYMTAAGLLIGLSTVSKTSSANSLKGVIASSTYGAIQGYIEQKLETAETPDAFRSSLNAYFDTVGTETQPASIVDGSFGYDGFKRLVQMIDKAGRSLKLSAGDFKGLNEEGYRSVITSTIGQRIDGNLVREPETGRGPADIRLQDNNGDVIYIGECKYWTEDNTGAEYNVKKPLEQLDTYYQHQLFDSIIIFFKSEDYSQLDINAVWKEIDEKLASHDTTLSLEDKMSETPRSRIYERQSARNNEYRYLSIHVFDVSATQHHEITAYA